MPVNNTIEIKNAPEFTGIELKEKTTVSIELHAATWFNLSGSKLSFEPFPEKTNEDYRLFLQEKISSSTRFGIDTNQDGRLNEGDIINEPQPPVSRPTEPENEEADTLPAEVEEVPIESPEPSDGDDDDDDDVIDLRRGNRGFKNR